MTHPCPRFSAAAFAAILAAAAASPVLAVGPDVIVGDLPGISFYTSSGPIGGIHAYAVGTTSCNIGDQPLQWISSTNRHPVISQNMYRLSNGRFEQIGQAWLKHGFTALQGTVCSPCNAYPNGTHLGPGCSDPYSSGLNGSQSGLGPKFEINPATGYFPYPFSNPSYSGALARRLQVRATDLQTPGALFFVASMYIAPDDIESGNGYNNESYRRVTAAANGALTLQGTTQRGRAAIEAWRDNGGGAGVADPNVLLSPVDIPGDGRMIVGSRAFDLGNGTFRYEYAVQNFNSDRAAQSLSVPIPAGAFVASVYFHDVDYHSGEPYALTDWVPAVTSTDISWSSETFAQNPNANALRWDTVYTFSFVSDAAPASGSVSIGLFKPGTPGAISAAATIPGGGPPPPPVPPANDNCASATVVAAGPSSFTTANATTDGPSEAGCGGAILADVWFRYTAPCDGTASVSTCGSGFDTRLAIYSASCPSASDAALACNDDSAACGAASVQSSVSFAVLANAQYLIRVGSASGATGAGSLAVTGPDCSPPPPPGVPNDACASAITLQDGVAVLGTSVGATNDGTASCGSSATSPDVWYAYTPGTTATVTVSTCNAASFDTVLSIHSACGGSQVACLDDTTGCSAYSTSLSATLTGGVPYLVRVAGYNGATGTFTLTASGGGAPPPPPPAPANDACDNRIGIPLGPTPFTTVGATTDGPAHATCTSGGQTLITGDIWFNHPSQATGTLTVSTCGSAYDSWIVVYDGYGCTDFDTRLMACSDDFACPGGGADQSQVAIPVVAGTSYTIRVGGFNGATGTGTLNLSFAATPPPSTTLTVVAFTAATAIPTVGSVENEDLAAYDPGTGQWTLLFDGSDVGLAGLAIDGAASTPNGDLLLSFTAAAAITGMTGGPGGSTTLDDSDIVRFIPTTLGANTAGSFVFYFDASDVGLSTDNEDVDAIALAADGRLILSTTSNFNTTGASGNDEDLILLTASSLGAATVGSFAMHFDGGDVGLGSTSEEDVAGAVVDAQNRILLATVGNFSVTGVTGTNDDIFAFVPIRLGSDTAGTYSMAQRLTAAGIASSAAIAAIDLRANTLPSVKGDDTACIADFDGDGAVAVPDIFAYLAAFIAGDAAADLDADGQVRTPDLFNFLAAYSAGCP